MDDQPAAEQLDLKMIIRDILATIEREREREIVSRRFGLYDRRETLEQIGELLGITRERVRQLEKAVITKLKASAEKDLPHINLVEQTLSDHLEKMGTAAKISDVTDKLLGNSSRLDQSRVAFLAHLSPRIAVIDVASISKNIAHLHGRWGLINGRWSTLKISATKSMLSCTTTKSRCTFQRLPRPSRTAISAAKMSLPRPSITNLSKISASY
jgi:hypothetical protein